MQNNRSCPLRSRLYGGIATGGGFSSAKEYEIGAQRMAEACHCILGSLGKNVGGDPHDWDRMAKYEGEHLREEFGIVNFCVKEYAQPVYTQQVNDAPDDKYVQMMVQSIDAAAPKLYRRAKAMRDELATIEDMPDDVRLAANLTYEVLLYLAHAMYRSIKNWAEEEEIVRNAFHDTYLRETIVKLGKALDAIYQRDSRAGEEEEKMIREISQAMWDELTATLLEQVKGESRAAYNRLSPNGKNIVKAIAEYGARHQPIRIRYNPKVTTGKPVYRTLHPYSLRVRDIYVDGYQEKKRPTIVFFGFDAHNQMNKNPGNKKPTIKNFVVDRIITVAAARGEFEPQWEVEFVDDVTPNLRDDSPGANDVNKEMDKIMNEWRRFA